MLDQTNDRDGRGLAKIARRFELPEYVVKIARELTPSPVAARSADPDRRRLPCHTKAATWLSAAYFADAAGEYAPQAAGQIRERLTKFANFWGIRRDVDEVLAKPAAAAEPVAAEEDYAYVVKRADSAVERRLPMRGPGEVKAAVDWLQRHRDDLQYSDRRTIAGRILTKAAGLDAGLDFESADFLARQAGYGLPDAAAAQRACTTRSLLVGQRSDLRDGYQKLAAHAAHALAADPVGFISTVETLDRELGVHGRYTANVPPMEDAVFGNTATKLARAQADLIELPGGRAFSRAELAAIPQRDLTAVMGHKWASAVSAGFHLHPDRMAAAWPELPSAARAGLGDLLQDRGVRSVAAGLSRADLEQLAALDV